VQRMKVILSGETVEFRIVRIANVVPGERHLLGRPPESGCGFFPVAVNGVFGAGQ
jgi:hypothetical protein